jgi:hypothetical protein
MLEHVAPVGEKKNAEKITVGKPEGKKPLGRPRHKRKIILKYV